MADNATALEQAEQLATDYYASTARPPLYLVVDYDTYFAIATEISRRMGDPVIPEEVLLSHGPVTIVIVPGPERVMHVCRGARDEALLKRGGK